MKTLKFSIIMLALFFSRSFAQAKNLNAETTNPKSGIYLTATDYAHHKLHLAGDQSAKNKFHLHGLFGGETLTVNHKGKNYQFSKDNIYGYKDKDGTDYRFYKSHSAEYKILESEKIVIYERQQAGSKQTNFKPLISYYFSRGADGDVYPLSLDNLKQIFKNEPAFDIVDTNFRSNGDLISYDIYHHEYRINYLLSKR
jgi:hypothetical protein